MNSRQGAALGVALAAAVTVAGVVATRGPSRYTGRTHAALDWPDGGRPQRVDCGWTTVLMDSQGRKAMGLDEDGPATYARLRVCEAPDAGPTRWPAGVYELTRRQPADGGSARVEAFMDGTGFDCACSSGQNCDWKRKRKADWGPAPTGMVLTAGHWRGAGCVPSLCTGVNGGPSVLPSACSAD